MARTRRKKRKSFLGRAADKATKDVRATAAKAQKATGLGKKKKAAQKTNSRGTPLVMKPPVVGSYKKRMKQKKYGDGPSSQRRTKGGR